MSKIFVIEPYGPYYEKLSGSATPVVTRLFGGKPRAYIEREDAEERAAKLQEGVLGLPMWYRVVERPDAEAFMYGDIG